MCIQNIPPPLYNLKNAGNNWPMLGPNCRPLIQGNLHLYVHALVCLSAFAFISACDLDRVILKSSPRKNNKHPLVFLWLPSDLVLLKASRVLFIPHRRSPGWNNRPELVFMSITSQQETHCFRQICRRNTYTDDVTVSLR